MVGSLRGRDAPHWVDCRTGDRVEYSDAEFETWFTRPAAEAIKLQLQKLAARKLATTVDSQLNVCTACLCPLKLKVHTPLPFILEHMSANTKAELDAKCWILSELSTTVDTTP